MTGKTKECWMEFCEQAAKEQDPKKLTALAKEINRLLQEKEDRPNKSRNSTNPVRRGKLNGVHDFMNASLPENGKPALLALVSLAPEGFPFAPCVDDN